MERNGDLDPSSATFFEALDQVQHEVYWAGDAIALYEMIKTMISQLAVKGGESFQDLYEKIKDLEKFLTIDLERHIAKRNSASPFYLDRILSLGQKAQDLISAEPTPDQCRLVDHLCAELQATFAEYGFCLTVEAIFEIGEATRHLDTLGAKLDKVEKAVRSGEDVCITIAELQTIIATINGMQQAMTPANISKIQGRIDGISQRIASLENNISSSQIKADSELFVRYLAGQYLLRKQFVNSIFDADSIAYVNEHMIHPGTRGWIVERVDRWLHKTEKRAFLIGGREGSGKTALSSAICKLYNHDMVASHFFDASSQSEGSDIRNHVNGLVQSLASDLCKTLPEYLNYLDDKFGEMDLRSHLSKNWQDSYRILLKEPLQALYGTGKAASAHSKRKLIVVDGLDECQRSEWNDLKAFIANFAFDLSSSFCIFLTVRNKFSQGIVPELDMAVMEGIRFEDRAWINRHIKDIEIYLTSSVGAILSGEDTHGTPSHAKADESTLQNAIDELLKCSSGRFDYAIELMESFAREMSTSSQFLTSLKKATAPVKQQHGDMFEQKMSNFSSPYRAYRDKEGRSVNVRVLRQSHYLMDKTRVALIRGRHRIRELSQ